MNLFRTIFLAVTVIAVLGVYRRKYPMIIEIGHTSLDGARR